MAKYFKNSEQQDLPETGLLRLKQVLQFIPVSRSTWLAGVKTGIFPKPLKLTPRTVTWRVEDIRAIINGGAQKKSKPLNER
jgi:predicted DNA-binding transcriptional regulator AlpA